jgi:hypothetical protein
VQIARQALTFLQNSKAFGVLVELGVDHRDRGLIGDRQCQIRMMAREVVALCVRHPHATEDSAFHRQRHPHPRAHSVQQLRSAGPQQRTQELGLLVFARHVRDPDGSMFVEQPRENLRRIERDPEGGGAFRLLHSTHGNRHQG